MCWRDWCCPFLLCPVRVSLLATPSLVLFLGLLLAILSLHRWDREWANLRHIERWINLCRHFPSAIGQVQSHAGIKDIVYRQEKALSSSFTPFSWKVFWESVSEKEEKDAIEGERKGKRSFLLSRDKKRRDKAKDDEQMGIIGEEKIRGRMVSNPVISVA